MIIHNPILTGSFTVNGTDVASITSSAASLTSLNAATASLNSFSASVLTFTASAATTGSNTFVGNQVVSGSLTVTGSITTPGTLTAQTLVVQTITSSVDFVTGSTQFGTLLSNTHVFSGSVTMNPGGLFVSSSGRVGIGTTNPSSLLHLFSSTSGVSYRIESTATNGEPSINFYGKNSSGTVRSFAIKYDNADVVRFGTSDAIPMRFETSDVARLTISANGTASFSGNVTLNKITTDTGLEYQVRNTNGASGDHVFKSYNTAILTLNGGTNAATFASSITAGSNIVIPSGYELSYGNGNVSILGNTSTNILDFRTNNGTKLYINSSGYVGIGNTNPLSPLHIGGALASSGDAAAITLKQTSTTATTGIYLERSGEQKGYYIYVGGSVDSLNFQRNNGGTKEDIISITRDGNVGLRSTTPSEKLFLQSGNFRMFDPSSGLNAGYDIQWASNNGGSDLSYAIIQAITDNAGVRSGNIRFLTANNAYPAERMRITSGGDVVMRYNAYVGNTASDSPAVITFQNVINGYQFGFQSIGTDRFTFVNGAPTEVGYLTGGGVFYSSGGGTSDRRMKQNIEYIETSGLNTIDLLKPASFEFIDNPEKKRRGFIAQDVLEVIPDLVLGNGDEEKGIYGLDYDGILALAIKAIQELKAEVDDLKSQLNK